MSEPDARSGEDVLGVVSAGHPDTAAAGVEVLQSGGNAVDAAVAAAFAAMAAEAALTGLGAGGFALTREPGGPCRVLDFFVAAAGKGRSSEDRESRSHLIKYYVPFRATTQLFNVGPSSCAVPGIVPGLCRLHGQAGSLSLGEVLAPAIRLARSGARLVPPQDYLHDILEGILTETEAMRALYAPDGTLLRAGDLFRMPDLAETLEVLAAEGPDAFTTGTMAQRMADHIEGAGGLITEQDLAEYEPIERDPVVVRYRGLDVLGNPLPSSGGTLIAFTLALLSEEHMSEIGPGERTLALADALAATAAARRSGFDERVSDPGFAAEFLSEENLAAYRNWRAARNGSTGTPHDRPGVRRHGGSRGNTTHISVVDQSGLTVSLTSSCGSGSGVVIPGTGIIMNNMMGEEDLNPGGAFALPPGARLTSMMAPTIACGTLPDRPGHPKAVIAVGSAGSERLRSAIVQTLVNTVDLALEGQTSVERPRLHVDGNTAHLEPGFEREAIDLLRAAGYDVHEWPEPDLFFGGVQLAVKTAPAGSGDSAVPGGDRFDGGGDPRRGGVCRLAQA